MTSSRFSQAFWSDAASSSAQAEGGSRPSQPLQTPAEIILSSPADDRPTQLCEADTDEVSPEAAGVESGGAESACGLFVPENYEPNYAYPLVIWLHETGRSERDIAAILPQISMRNYIGLSLRGTQRAATDEGFSWNRSEHAATQLEEEIFARVKQLRSDFHIHTERVFLVGAGDGGTAAWDLFLARPQWFAGIADLGGRFPFGRRPLRQFRNLSGKHALIVADNQNPANVARARRAGRLLYSAGLETAVRVPGCELLLSKPLFRQIDRWIMQAIGGCL